jgi:hypothetical protein
MAPACRNIILNVHPNVPVETAMKARNCIVRPRKVGNLLLAHQTAALPAAKPRAPPTTPPLSVSLWKR